MKDSTFSPAGDLIIPAMTAPFVAIRDRSLRQDLGERLNVLQELLISSVGNTPLIRAKNLEKLWGIEDLYLKFEGNNPTGTQKDRVAFHHVIDALENGYDTLIFTTCGNYGVAMAFASYLVGIRCVIYMPEDYDWNRRDEMEAWEAEVVRGPGDYEGTVKFSSYRAQCEGWYDANPGPANAEIQIKAYHSIADEISHKLGQMPSTVAAPIGNGTVIAGIHQGFLSLGENALPRMIAGSIARQNPVLVSFESGHKRCEDISPDCLHETHTNMPLINWHALDGEEALQSLYHSRGLAQGLSDQEMVELSDLLYRQEGISALPAATAGLGALICAHLQGNIGQGPHVAVLTARNM